MKRHMLLVAVGCLFVAASAFAATGPEGAWPCVGGNNQLTGTFTPVVGVGKLLGETAWTIDDYETSPGGSKGAVLIDANDNIYLSVIDVDDSLQKQDTDGNLL